MRAESRIPLHLQNGERCVSSDLGLSRVHGTRVADIRPLRSLCPPVIPAMQHCRARSSVYPVPSQAAGRVDTSQATSMRQATLFVRPSHLRLRSSTLTLPPGVPIPYPGVDTRSGTVFCADCDDFIYDATIDAVYLSTVILIEEQMTRFQGETASL
jgi:hypothetical protein